MSTDAAVFLAIVYVLFVPLHVIESRRCGFKSRWVWFVALLWPVTVWPLIWAELRRP